ncbi:MAG: NDP-sugar synthase [Nitrospirota bacterium]
MKAMILAAGFGTRLRPYTLQMPKPLLPMGGRPLIYYSLSLLKKHRITDVVINLHYQGEKIISELGDGSEWGMKISYSSEREILGTGGGIKKAEKILSDNTFIVINGDIIVDIDLDKLIEFHYQNKAIATMVLRENREKEEYGVIEIDSQNRIRQFLRRLKWEGEKLKELMFTGVHILEPEIFNYIPEDVFYNITDTYIEMIERGKAIFGYVIDGYWSDPGTIERFEMTREEFKKR